MIFFSHLNLNFMKVSTTVLILIGQLIRILLKLHRLGKNIDHHDSLLVCNQLNLGNIYFWALRCIIDDTYRKRKCDPMAEKKKDCFHTYFNGENTHNAYCHICPPNKVYYILCWNHTSACARASLSSISIQTTGIPPEIIMIILVFRFLFSAHS